MFFYPISAQFESACLFAQGAPGTQRDKILYRPAAAAAAAAAAGVGSSSSTEVQYMYGQ